MFYLFFFKQKTAYEMRISDWSSDVCSSDLDRGDVMSVALPHVRGPGFAASAAGIAIHGKAGRLRHASTGCEQYRAKYGEKRTTGRIIIQAHQLCPMAFMSSSDIDRKSTRLNSSH